MSTQAFEVPPAIEGCLEACRRCRILVEAIAASGEKTSREAYAVVGPHLRHCLDHFVCLFRGIEHGVVDYDRRDRDGELERDAATFLRAMDAIIDRLLTLDPVTVQQSLLVRQEAAPGGRALCVDTNLQRELVFLSSHTIHHIAIMTMLARGQGVEVPERLGVAFSTATFCGDGSIERDSERPAVARRTPSAAPRVEI